MIAAKIMKKYKQIQNMSTNDKSIDIFEYDSSENNEQILKKNNKCQNMSKTLTFLNMIAAKIMKTY